MAVTIDRRMSLADYLIYDDETENRYQLMDGVLVQMGAESDPNVSIAMFLISILLQVVPYNLLRRGTEIAVPGIHAETRYPDLIVLTEACEAALSGKKRSCITFDMPVPAIVIEAVSNSQKDKKSRDRDYIDKQAEYAGRGIPEYWIINPIQKWIWVLTLHNNRYQKNEFKGNQAIVSPTFPKLHLTAEQILNAGE